MADFWRNPGDRASVPTMVWENIKSRLANLTSQGLRSPRPYEEVNDVMARNIQGNLAKLGIGMSPMEERARLEQALMGNQPSPPAYEPPPMSEAMALGGGPLPDQESFMDPRQAAAAGLASRGEMGNLSDQRVAMSRPPEPTTYHGIPPSWVSEDQYMAEQLRQAQMRGDPTTFHSQGRKYSYYPEPGEDAELAMVRAAVPPAVPRSEPPKMPKPMSDDDILALAAYDLNEDVLGPLPK